MGFDSIGGCMGSALKLAALWLMAGTFGCAQILAPIIAGNAHTAVVVFQATVSSNSNSSIISVAPSTFQHGNYGTGCTGGVIQPTGPGDQVGQLYATSAIATAAIAAGCAIQSFPTVTNSSGSRTTAATDNGHGAGGTDSATAFTDTYGGNTEDSVCTGDTSHSLPYLVAIAVPACVANATAQFAETTAPSFGNADMLWLSFYASNSTNLDLATNVIDDVYFMPTSLSTLHDLENDTGIVSSPNSFMGTSKANVVWGTHWNSTAAAFQYCPQGCSAWVTLKLCDITSPSTCISTEALTNNTGYRAVWYETRGAVGSTYCYNFLTFYAMGSSPKTYALYDNNTGGPPCGTAINQPTYASGVYLQNQLDMTTANASSAYYIISRTTTFYYMH